MALSPRTARILVTAYSARGGNQRGKMESRREVKAHWRAAAGFSANFPSVAARS